MPTISPARTSNDTSRNPRSPSLTTTDRFRTFKTARPAFASGFSTRSKTSRPTIIRASSAASVSAVGTCPTTRPSRITVTSSEMASTSESL